MRNGRSVGAWIVDLLRQTRRRPEAPYSAPGSTLDRLRQAEQVLPGLREKIEQSGRSEEAVAEQIDERIRGAEPGHAPKTDS